MTNPYLEPVGSTTARIAGVALLVAAAILTAALAYALFGVVRHDDALRAFNSSSLVFALILLALDGICWQAGVRLTFNRRDGDGSLFARPTWFVIGAALIVMAVLMAATILSARRPTLVDYQVVLSLGAFGIWCVVLALRSRAGGGR